jgi:hypothetical protein
MPIFTIRVELDIGATSDDYRRLNAHLGKIGMEHEVVANDGSRYVLPTGEFIYENPGGTAVSVRDTLAHRLSNMELSFSTLVTEGWQRASQNLKRSAS